MNRKEFCEHFNIPYRTVTEWGVEPAAGMLVVNLYPNSENLLKR